MHARLAVPALALCACAVARTPPPAPPAASRATIAFAMPDVPPAPPAPPIALEADDGHGLRLASLEARTRVTGPLASTELHLRFVSDVARVIEGRFRVALPPRSFASRLAMKIDGRFREADVVETAVARSTYEETMHVRRDPLLVEQREDNELTARVFPIPALGEKEIIVGWVSEIGASSRITIPLRGLPQLDALDVRVTSGERELFARKAESAIPTEDVRIAAPAASAGLRAGESVVMRVRLGGGAAPEPIGRGMLMLVDTSASTASELDATLALLGDVAARLAEEEPSARFVVATFDQEVRVVHEGAASFGGAAARIRANGALGASDLGAALAWAAKRTDVDRVVVVGDGLATAGTSSRAKLREAAAAIGVRVDAIAVGDARDEPLLQDLAHGGVVSQSSLGAQEIASRLARRTLPKTVVSVPGARWSWPTTFDNALEGDERFVYAELPDGVPLRASVGTRRVALDAQASPTAERAVAKAKIDAASVAAEERGWDDASRAAVVALARKHTLASPLTSMIVVESDVARAAMEARRSVRFATAPPRSKSDDMLAPPPPIPPATAVGRGRMVVHHSTPRPLLVREAMVQVNGRVPPEVIQRIVRQSWGRFRGCYLEGYLRNAKLRGRVATKIVIMPDGNVQRTEDAGSDLPDPRVVKCVVDAFRELTFPASENAWITVVYPILFRPAEEADEEERSPQPQSLAATSPKGLRTPEPPPPPPPLAWTGTYAWVRDALDDDQVEGALAVAAGAHARAPRDPAVLVALGEAFEAAGLHVQAARAYASLADLEPHRADRLRATAGRLAAIAELPLAIELARRAAEDRPDMPSSYTLLATLLLQSGAREEAFDVLLHALGQTFAPRFGDARQVLDDLLGIVASAWSAAEPARADEIDRRARVAAPLFRIEPETRAIVTWESDPSTVRLVQVLSDSRTDLGAIHAEGYGADEAVVYRPDAGLEVRSGALGPNLEPTFGLVTLLTHDGRGRVSVEPRPFVLMREYARAPLKPSSGSRARSPSSRGD